MYCSDSWVGTLCLEEPPSFLKPHSLYEEREMTLREKDPAVSRLKHKTLRCYLASFLHLLSLLPLCHSQVLLALLPQFHHLLIWEHFFELLLQMRFSKISAFPNFFLLKINSFFYL